MMLAERRPILLANARIIDPSRDLAPLLERKPELVLLGTGERQVFPSGRVLAAFAGCGIGFEVMDNGAACRTFNLLLQEGRDVVLALILPEGPDPQGGSDPNHGDGV